MAIADQCVVGWLWLWRQVNAIACTALLEGLCRAQDMGEADKLLARMEVQGPAPTAVTYQTYLHGLSKVRDGELQQGLRLLLSCLLVCPLEHPKH